MAAQPSNDDETCSQLGSEDNLSYDRGNRNMNKIAQLETQNIVILAKH